jgi:hypothetical protein
MSTDHFLTLRKLVPVPARTRSGQLRIRILAAATLVAIFVFCSGSVSVAAASAIDAEPAAIRRDGSFNAITPVRFLDTRLGIGAPVGPVLGGQTFNVQIANRLGLPVASQIKAIVMNVTVAESTTGGYLTIYPNGIALPGVSNINYEAGRVIANLTTVTIGSNGFVSAFNSSGSVHLILDVVGWYSSNTGPDGGNYVSLNQPSRIYDSRTVLVSGIAPNTALNVPYTFSTWVTAALVNVTVTRTKGTGYVSAYPSGIAPPNASTLNFRPGADVANMAIVKKGANGQISIFNGSSGAVDVIVDLAGVFDDGTYPTAFPSGVVGQTLKGTFFGTVPFRWIDTRSPGWERLHPNTFIPFDVPPGVPANATALVLNVTAVDPTDASYFVVYECTRPETSTVNFAAGQTIANQAVAGVCLDSQSGRRYINVFNPAGHNHLVLDVQGWFG